MKHFDIEGDIERGIEAAQNVTIETAIAEAIIKGTMSLEEGSECIDAYYRYLDATSND